MDAVWPWLALGLLGAYHGLNPAMGWLFAVGLGLQEQRRGAVLGAFAPIALGHGLSIAIVVAVVGLLQMVVTPNVLQIAGAGVLLAFAFYRIVTRAAGDDHRHVAGRSHDLRLQRRQGGAYQ